MAELGVTYLPYTFSSDAGYADLPLALCGNIFGKQIGNVFVFTICFDVGLVENDNKSAYHLRTNLKKTFFEPI